MFQIKIYDMKKFLITVIIGACTLFTYDGTAHEDAVYLDVGILCQCNSSSQCVAEGGGAKCWTTKKCWTGERNCRGSSEVGE